jgi:hypothetical protein
VEPAGGESSNQQREHQQREAVRMRVEDRHQSSPPADIHRSGAARHNWDSNSCCFVRIRAPLPIAKGRRGHLLPGRRGAELQRRAVPARARTTRSALLGTPLY